MISQLLFNKYKPAAFFALKMQEKDIETCVLLQPDEQLTDITFNHAIVGEQPFLIAVWNVSLPAKNRPFKMCIQRKNKTIATLRLQFHKAVHQEGYPAIYLFEAIDYTAGFRSAMIRGWMALKKKQHKSFHLSGLYAAAYHFPRKVILTIFKSGDYFNIFPMDFQGSFSRSNLHILGLRNTNITLKKIEEVPQLLIADFEPNDLTMIYQLGKHHSSAPPLASQLPFGTFPSEKFAFPVPEFVFSYKELQVIQIINTGSHSLIIGKTVHTKQLKPQVSCLYHIDATAFLNAEKQLERHFIS